MSKTSQRPQILLITDQDASLKWLEEILPESNLPQAKLIKETSSTFMRRSELDSRIDVIIIDDRLDEMSSMDMLVHCTEHYPNCARLLLTRKSDRQRAVDAMKQGATDYLFKRDLNPDLLSKAFKHCMDFSRQQDMLNRRNAVIDALFDQAEEAIFLSDEKGSLVLTNKIFTELFRNEQPIEGSFKRFVNTYITKEPLYPFVSQNGPISEVITMKPDEGEVRSLRIHLKTIKLSDRYERVLGMITDITSERVAEEEQRKTEKLEMTARMAQILAHEIRNPLTNIRLSADYLNEEFSDKEEIVAYSEIIERNVTRVDDLIHRLLQSVKPFEIKKEDTDLSRFLEFLKEHIKDRQKLLEADVQIQVKPKGLSWNIDPDKLELALLNLINNAFQAMMKTERPSMKILLSEENSQLKIVIQDNGSGMTEETKNKLFDAFYSQRKGGLGLGMMIVKNIIEAHSGNISVESAEARGTSFTISLP